MKTTTFAMLTALAAWMGAPTSRAETLAPAAVLCPKCETVWVKSQVGEKARSYTRVGKMICPDCRSAVENVFAGGPLEHACETCGDLEACRAEQVSAARQDADQALRCAKCETTWVRRARQVGKITIYRTAKSLHCAPCDEAAMNTLVGNSPNHACADCGDGLKMCE